MYGIEIDELSASKKSMGNHDSSTRYLFLLFLALPSHELMSYFPSVRVARRFVNGLAKNKLRRTSSAAADVY